MATTTPQDPELELPASLPAKWKGKDAALIAGLIQGMSYQQAGDRAGLSKATVKRRMKDPAFRRVVQQQHSLALEVVRRQASARAVAAMQVLTQVMADRNGEAARPGAQVRVSAAGRLLETFARLQPRDVNVEGDLVRPTVDVVLVGVDVEDLT